MQKNPKQKEPSVRLSLYLPGDLRKALRIQAIEEGISATKLVERLIREYLSKKIPKKEGEK